MAAKEEINDAAEQLEQKRRELRESLRREALVLQELQATQLCVQELQKEVLYYVRSKILKQLYTHARAHTTHMYTHAPARTTRTVFILY